MTEYRFIYKCRLCGGTNENTCVGNVVTAQNMLIRACLGNPKIGNQDTVEILTTHICMDGQMGIADLQGYRRVKTEE